MRRNKGRTSRFLGIVLVLVTLPGLFLAVRKLMPAKAPPLLVTHEVPSGSEPGLVTNAPEPVQPDIVAPLPVQIPATQPAGKTAPSPLNPTAAAEKPAPVGSGNPLADGQALFAAGDVIAARQLVNEALVNGRLGSNAESAKALLSQINQAAIHSPRIFKDDPYCVAYTVQNGDLLTRIASANSVTWELLCRINNIPDPRRLRAGQTIKVIKGPFHAVITKSRFVMDIYLATPGEPGGLYVMSFPVGLGKDGSTPPGLWMVTPHKKLKNPTYFSPRGEGIIAADDPTNPLGEYWIGLGGIDGQTSNKVSYGIHGTIEPDSIGKEASMGCIRLRNADIALVWELLVEGKSTVTVKE